MLILGTRHSADRRSDRRRLTGDSSPNPQVLRGLEVLGVTLRTRLPGELTARGPVLGQGKPADAAGEGFGKQSVRQRRLGSAMFYVVGRQNAWP